MAHFSFADRSKRRAAFRAHVIVSGFSVSEVYDLDPLVLIEQLGEICGHSSLIVRVGHDQQNVSLESAVRRESRCRFQFLRENRR